jgi:xanthine dehydrogenase YagR molybdenum-binding subunit
VTLAAMAAKMTNRPVKIVLARPQMFGVLGYRPQTVQRVALGTGRDGKLTSVIHQLTTQTSAFDEFVEPSGLLSTVLYGTPNLLVTHRVGRLNTGTPTYMRAPGESSGSFALESAMDELAHALGMDPVALRLRNYAEVDPHDGKPFSSKSLRQCYELGARRFGWERRVARPRATLRDGMLVGMGMATSSYPANFSKAAAIARLSADGSALVQSGAVDIGTGTYTVMTQVAADAIGLAPQKVKFELGDSEMPEAPRSGGSQTAASVASAVLLAGTALREKLVLLAVEDPRSPLHGASVASVQVEDGRLTASGGRSDTFAQIVARSGGKPIEAHGHAEPGPERKKYSLHSFGAQFAEVHVDPDLGTVRVARLIGAFAAGRILNALLARSQLMGGMVWGIGMALHEHTVYDEQRGRIASKDLADYHVPTNADVLELEPLFLPVEEDPNVDPAGVKGIGEIGITGTAAAIANAVFNATGRRIRALPITPDKLL